MYGRKARQYQGNLGTVRNNQSIVTKAGRQENRSQAPASRVKFKRISKTLAIKLSRIFNAIF